VVEQRRATSSDVAREAGVSRTTVSFVLNGKTTANISIATRQRVLEAADRLGYTPAATARDLRRRHSEGVLCLLPRWPIHTAVGDYLEQLSVAFDSCAFTFVVRPHTPSTPLSEVWTRLRPAALLVFEDLAPHDQATAEQVGMPVFVVSLVETNDNHANVGQYTNENLGRLQAQHLIERGHERIGYAYPDNPQLEYFAQARLLGVQQVMRRMALPMPAVIPVNLSERSAASAVKAWRRKSPSITAVCAFNDEVAIAVLAALRGMNLNSPGELAVVGADDIPAAALAIPPLTTVRRSMADMAQQTVQAVLQRLGRTPPAEWPPGSPPEVIQRATT
jgi:DNA-binding LacI/PurR family transcriptional regulator